MLPGRGSESRGTDFCGDMLPQLENISNDPESGCPVFSIGEATNGKLSARKGADEAVATRNGSSPAKLQDFSIKW